MKSPEAGNIRALFTLVIKSSGDTVSEILYLKIRLCSVVVDLVVIARSAATKQSQMVKIIRHEIALPSARNDITN